MNVADLPDLPAVALGAGLWFALLWVCAWARNRRVTTAVKTCAGIITVIALFLPINGIALWSRVFSFYPNPSLPMLGLLCAALSKRLFGLVVFRRVDWFGIWAFGGVAGTVLYLHPMVLGSVDLYYWGWDRTSAVLTLAGLSVALLVCGHRLGILLLAALLSYALGTLESHNCWDYIVDPFYWVISGGILAAQAAMALSRRLARGAQPAEALLPPSMDSSVLPVASLAEESRTL